MEEMNILFFEAPFFIGNKGKKIRRECGTGGAAILQNEKARV